MVAQGVLAVFWQGAQQFWAPGVNKYLLWITAWRVPGAVGWDVRGKVPAPSHELIPELPHIELCVAVLLCGAAPLLC